MTNEESLPLFPLQVVLFPGSSLALHIFEERYKSLINKCISEGSEFGINCASEDGIATVGCSARVTEVLRRFDDGRMDIVVRGHRRYILSHYDTTETPYLVGVVQFLERTSEAIDKDLARETIQLFNTVVDMVYKTPEYRISSAEVPGSISFLLAQKSGLQLSERQHLLELGSENARLAMLRHHLHELLPKLKQVEQVERVIHCDGYL